MWNLKQSPNKGRVELNLKSTESAHGPLLFSINDDDQERWFRESFHQIPSIKSSFSGLRIQFVRATFHMLLDTLITSPLDSALTPGIHYGPQCPVPVNGLCQYWPGPGPCVYILPNLEENWLSYFQIGYFFKILCCCHDPKTHLKCR